MGKMLIVSVCTFTHPPLAIMFRLWEAVLSFNVKSYNSNKIEKKQPTG